MKKMMLVTGMLLLFASIRAQTVLQNSKTTDHILIPGTQIAMQPPVAFELTSQFIGFQETSSGASIMVLQIPGPIEKVTEGLTKETLATKGIELIDSVGVTINGREGKLLQMKQFSAAHGYGFLKYTLVLPLQKNVCVMINGNYPESLGDKLGPAIKQALLSVFYDDQVKLDPFSALDFTLDLSKSAFKLQNSISGTLYLSGNEKEKFIIVKSIRPVQSIDKKGASIQILKALSAYSYKDLVSSKEVEIDYSEGYQIIANILEKGKPMKAIQTVLFGENYYYNFTLIVPDYTKAIQEDYEYILNSFKRK